MFRRKKRKGIFSIIGLLLLLITAGYTYLQIFSLPAKKLPNDDQLKNTAYEDGLLFKSKDEMDDVGDINTRIIYNYGLETTHINTDLIFESIYEFCSDRHREERKVNIKEIGISQDKMALLYPDWNIVDFSRDRVLLRKSIRNYCSKHYIIKDKNGYVVIFTPKPDEEGFNQLEVTEIKTEWLSKELQDRITEGIIVDSLEEIEYLMESWDS